MGANKAAAVDGNKSVKGVSKAAVDASKAGDATNLAESGLNNSKAKTGRVCLSTTSQQAL